MSSAIKVGMVRVTLLISAGLLATCVSAFGEHKMISLGDRMLYIDCDGKGAPGTVILMSGAASTTKVWAKVQARVSSFARVCSYDRAGDGESDKPSSKQQSVDEAVDDLHKLLKASNETGPFILVAHSRAGLYARRFVTTFPREVAALVFVDSSHEEQALRQHELDPKGLELNDEIERVGFFVKTDEHLDWRTDVPLVVLARGKPFPRTTQMTEEQFEAWDRIWRAFQEDLSKRSSHGEFRVAERSGHFIQLDQPELVVQAIRDVSQPIGRF